MSPRPCSSHLVKDRLVRRNSAGDGALFTRCRRSRLKIDEDDARDEGPHGDSRKEAACWVSRGPRLLTRIDSRPTARPLKGTVENGVVKADTPFLVNALAASCGSYCVVDVYLQ
uniref:Uncharacterized protein n=1 Tax=Hyaloperonospora arabidopsidis (strain Emoy2) TaxID=559515 RepID=M4BW05_HYAAE